MLLSLINSMLQINLLINLANNTNGIQNINVSTNISMLSSALSI